MKMKIAGIVLLVAVAGVLTFGAINRTLAHNETATNLSRNLNSEALGRGNGSASTITEGEVNNGRGNGGGRNAIQNQDSFLESDHQDHEAVLDTLPVGELNQDEINALAYMAEEEKLARDVYTYLYEQWNLNIFNNIAASEQHHMDSVKDLLVRYELKDVTTNQAGVFENPDLQALYNQLIAQGSQSLEDALMVGGAIEEIDILDLQERLLQTEQADIQMVFESLLNGSYNHLNAFTSNYSRQSGSTYQPQYMTQEAYQAIIGSSSGGNGQGQGGRGGGGRGNSSS
jgi:hypothetical protein